MKRVSDNTILLIKFFEGFRPAVYICSGGYKTIGYGHALKKGEDDLFKNNITEEAAGILLDKDIEQAAAAVTRLIHVELNDNEYGALVSFTFNLGSGALQRSTLRSCLNRREYGMIPNELRKWVYAGGKKLPGLVRRRNTEAILFQTGVLIL